MKTLFTTTLKLVLDWISNRHSVRNECSVFRFHPRLSDTAALSCTLCVSRRPSESVCNVQGIPLPSVCDTQRLMGLVPNPDGLTKFSNKNHVLGLGKTIDVWFHEERNLWCSG